MFIESSDRPRPSNLRTKVLEGTFETPNLQSPIKVKLSFEGEKDDHFYGRFIDSSSSKERRMMGTAHELLIPKDNRGGWTQIKFNVHSYGEESADCAEVTFVGVATYEYRKDSKKVLIAGLTEMDSFGKGYLNLQEK